MITVEDGRLCWEGLLLHEDSGVIRLLMGNTNKAHHDLCL